MTSNKKVSQILNEHEQGLITDAERYNKIIDVWTHTTNNVSKSLMEKIKIDQHGFNSLHMMVDSGARGSQEQVRQLAGMRGLMMKPQKSLSGNQVKLLKTQLLLTLKKVYRYLNILFLLTVPEKVWLILLLKLLMQDILQEDYATLLKM